MAFDYEYTGTEGADSILGTMGLDALAGFGGSDTIRGRGADDSITGGEGNDDLYAGSGADTVHGGSGDDVARGGLGADQISGGLGNDQLFGGADDDRLLGAGNNDLLLGGMGNDVLRGGTGADTLQGGQGSDNLGGGPGADRVYGAAGADTIDLGTGKGSETDAVVYSSVDEGALPGQNTGFDHILGLVPGEDLIGFEGAFAAAIDDISTDGSLPFVEDAQADFHSTDEAMFITGMTNAQLMEAGFVTLIDKMNTFGITAAAGDDALVVARCHAWSAVYYYQENGTAPNHVEADEITLIAVPHALVDPGTDFMLGLG